MKKRTKFEQSLLSEMAGPSDRMFCTVLEHITGIEDINIRAKFKKVHNRLMAKARKVSFTSIMDRIGEREYCKLTKNRTARLAKRISTEKENGRKAQTSVSLVNPTPYINEQSLLIVEKIDAAIREDSKRPKSLSKKQKQMEIDRSIVRKFYSNPTPNAFNTLWDRFRFGVHSHLAKIVGDWERAEDMVQETFIRAWEKRYMYDPDKSNFSTWLYTIARNITFSQLKKDGQDRTIDVDVNDVFASTLHPNGDNAATVDNTYYVINDSNQIESNDFEEVTMKMYDASINEILTMDPLFQVICKMKNQDDMTLREIAETLNMTESKVKNCYYKNKEVLKETLIEKYNDLYIVYRDASHDKDEEESAFY